MMNSILTTNFKGDYFKKERKDMLRQRNGNQYAHGDGFSWNKKKVHWCINNKFPCLKMIFRRSINLMDYLHSHRTTVGLFYPGEMIDLSHCEFSPGPLLIHDRHRQDSNQHEIICALNQSYPTVCKKIIKLWWRRVRCYCSYYINGLWTKSLPVHWF